MKIEIWSDVVCPFCYIGKRRLEQALAGFAHRADVQVQWKSYELDPNFEPVPGESVYTSLARKKGISEAESRRMSDYMANMAQEVGLNYQFDRAIPANTLLAHQLIHFAAQQGQQAAAKERLFAAYYLKARTSTASTRSPSWPASWASTPAPPARPWRPTNLPTPCAATSTRPSRWACGAYPSSCSTTSTPYRARSPARYSPKCWRKYGPRSTRGPRPP